MITYVPNEKGYALRKLHEHFSSYLQGRYRPSTASYAYMKKKNIAMCASRHLSSNVFFKTDIHAYFDSISEERMLKRIHRLQRVKLDWDVLAELTKACF